MLDGKKDLWGVGDFTSAIPKVPVGQRVYLDDPTARLPSAIRRACTCWLLAESGSHR